MTIPNVGVQTLAHVVQDVFHSQQEWPFTCHILNQVFEKLFHDLPTKSTDLKKNSMNDMKRWNATWMGILTSLAHIPLPFWTPPELNYKNRDDKDLRAIKLHRDLFVELGGNFLMPTIKH